jgi:ABC-type Na+ efflux pump permease subunit
MVRDLRVVLRTELTLLWRGRGWPIAALFVALLGMWEASGIREQPWGAWGTIAFASALLSLMLLFTTGNQVSSDRTRRLDGVLLSTPVSTTAYVCGKYLAALVALLSLASVNLVGALLADRFDPWRDPPAVLGHVRFPPLGPWPYVSTSVLLIVTPLVFGAAFVLAITTMARGERAGAYGAAVVLWLLPAFGTAWPQLLDVSGLRFYAMVDSIPAFKLAMTTINIRSGNTWSATAAAHVIATVRALFPPPLPPVFVWNRVLFLGLAVLLLATTVGYVQRQRCGRV